MYRNPISILLAFVLTMMAFAEDPRGIADDRDIAVLKTSKLECLIGNNKSYAHNEGRHNAGYNGLFSIRSVDENESPFVTAYAGLNMEHYFDARRRDSSEVFFEPRYSSMTLDRESETSVVLHQPPTATYEIESWTRFAVREPYSIDFTFRCVPVTADFDGGFFGVFWASYINAPIDKSIYFLDAESTLDKPMWQQFVTQQHNRDSTVRGRDDDSELEFRETGSALFSSISPVRYGEPFFYGRFRNMVLIYAFRSNPGLRFAQSPSGGGVNEARDDTNPAWDFQLIVPRVQAGKEYKLDGCLIYKPWRGRDDVLAEVRKFYERERR